MYKNKMLTLPFKGIFEGSLKSIVHTFMHYSNYSLFTYIQSVYLANYTYMEINLIHHYHILHGSKQSPS